MRRIIGLTALALALSGGAAFADRGHGGHGGGGGGRVAHEGGARVADHRSYGGGHAFEGRRVYGGGGGYHGGGAYYRGGSYYRGGYGGYRRPIYGERPFIRERYFDYYHRPSLIVENYAPMDGYTWVPGSWQWDGQEWIWQQGHYEPIAYNYGY